MSEESKMDKNTWILILVIVLGLVIYDDYGVRERKHQQYQGFKKTMQELEKVATGVCEEASAFKDGHTNWREVVDMVDSECERLDEEIKTLDAAEEALTEGE